MKSNERGKSGLNPIHFRVREGSWVVKNACGTTPAIIGRKLPLSYYHGNTYFEVRKIKNESFFAHCLQVDIDITKNRTANSICRLVIDQVAHLSICLAFVLEARNNEELPEQILGAIEFSRINLSNCVQFSKLSHQQHSNSVKKK